MADRSVRVRISADTSNFDRKLAGATAETEAFNRKLDDGQKSIDRYSGRLGVLLDVALGLAPALAPIGAELVPATAALGSNLGAVVVSAAVTKLAFHGIGDALKAFNKAELEPTTANIQAAQQAMDKLPPSGQRFVLMLHQLTPEVKELQRVSADGILPGVSAGLRSVQADLPIVRRGIRDTSNEIGQLARDTGDALSSRQWRPFLRFIGTETPQAIDTLGRAGGHTLHGLATLLMGFGPTTEEIDRGLLRLAVDFDHWATVTERSKTFENFLEYLRQNGPRVIDLLGQTGTTFLDIGRAVAPLGGPTLDILTRLLTVVDDIAKSDFGTPIYGAIVAWRLYARVAQLAGVQVETSFASIRKAPAQIEAGITRLSTTTRSATSSMIADLRAMGAEYQREARTIQTSNRSLFFSGVGSPEFFNPALTGSSRNVVDKETSAVGRLKSTYLSYLSQTSEAAVRTRARLGEVVKTGGQAAGVALVASGVADKVGLADTATFGLIGTLAGPYGAAVGGAVGLTMDLAHADNTLVDAQRRVQSIFDASSTSVDLGQQAADFGELNSQLDSTFTKIDQFKGIGSILHPIDSLKTEMLAVNNLFTHNIQDSVNVANAAGDAMGKNLTIFTQLHDKFTGTFTPVALSTADLQQTAERAQPAMLALGISVQDLQDAYDANDGSLDRLNHRIVEWTNRSESASGRTQAVQQAFAQLSDASLTLDQRITAAKTALDNLFSPKLNLSATRNSYLEALRGLKQQLANPADASSARLAVQQAQITYHNAVKAHGKDSAEAKLAAERLQIAQQKLADATRGTSKAILGTSDAALKNQDAIRGIVTQMLSFINAQIDSGKSAHDIIATYHQQRAALIATATQLGINKHDLEIYLKQLGFTPKAISTAVHLAGLDKATRQLDALTRARIAQIKVKVSNDEGINVTGGHIATGQADGGTVRGPRHPYGDKVLTMLAPGEQVISNRYGQADQFRADRAAGRIPAYADGGIVTRRPLPRGTGVGGFAQVDIQQLARAVAAMRPTPPLYGDVYLQPHNYDQFLREMDQDRAMAAISGVRHE